MKRKDRLMLFAAVLAVFLVLEVAVYLRIRSSIRVRAGETISNAGVVYFCQKDDRWREDSLGTSVYRMGDSGCLTTCIASVLRMEKLDGAAEPKQLNRLFSQNDVYDKDGNIQWEPLCKTLAITVDRKEGMTSAQIEELLERGRYPIVRVRVAGIGSFHYVVIVESREGEFYCMDPALKSQKTVPLSRFGERIYVALILESICD